MIHRRSLPRWPLAALALPLLVGCSHDDVQVYETPYEKQRLLGAIVLGNRESWFFKLMGRADDTAANRDDFLKFVKSLQFHPGAKEPVTWDLPPGWKAELAGPTGMGIRHASIYIPRDQVVLVSRLSDAGGGVVQNLNRWRGQLKLPALNGEELLKQCERIPTADGDTALVIDFESARAEAEIAAPPKREPTAAPEPGALKYDVPAGWKELSAAGKLWKAGFRVEADGKSADITLTPLGGAAGGIASNIDRWRVQVGLPPASEDQIRKDSQLIDVAGQKCPYVDLVGSQQRILAVICPVGEQTWFIKMQGPVELVGKQKPTFEAFAKSLRFGGEK